MGRKTKAVVLALSVLLVVSGGQALRGADAPKRAASPKPVLQQASVTVPEPADPLVVQAALSSNTRGWTRGSGAAPAADQGIRPELVDAYTLAVALAPAECHISLSLLAAIGQVESGNLAGHRIDARHRVVPGVLGPVLDGSTYAEIPDTDGGKWDGNSTWDRALGPMQLLPASWRVAGMDTDGDGQRDPQNVYDAAGTAMVYLCDSGRDLGTRKGLEEAVLAYNHSQAYLEHVLAWKTVFDTADVTGLGSVPTAWAVPTILAPTPARPAGGSSAGQPSPPVSSPTGSPESGPNATAAQPPTVTPSADSTSGPTVVPTASNPPAPTAKPTRKPDDKPADKPGKRADKPSDKPGDEPLPTCPTDEPTPTDDPSAEPTCCPAEPPEPTATPTPTPSADPSASPSEDPDPCATESPTPTASPTP